MGKRADLKNIACGLLHSFVSRNNDLDGYWALGKLHVLAKRHGTSALAIELWPALSADSLGLELAPMRAHYAAWLRAALLRHTLPAEVLQRATVTFTFDRDDLRDTARARGYLDAPPFLCSVHLVNDHGREYRAEAIGACWPHDPRRETRSTRVGLQ